MRAGGGANYAFDTVRPHLVNAMPAFGSQNLKSPNHTKELDLKALYLASCMPGVKIFSICESAVLNQYIPLAEIQNDQPMTVQEKDKDALRDFIPLPSPSGGGIFARSFRCLGLSSEYEILKQTIFGHFFIDLWIVLKTGLRILIKLLQNLFKKKNARGKRK